MNAQSKFKFSETICAAVAIIISPLLHFTYAWSNQSIFVSLFSPVNESVWEHTKMLFFPVFIFSIIQYFIVKPDFWRFLVAKTVALFFTIAITISFFYTYTGMFGGKSLIVDIICTLVWAALAYVISYKHYNSKKSITKTKYVALCALLIMIFLQFAFTPLAPKMAIPLFEHSYNGKVYYGYPSSEYDSHEGHNH